MSASIGTRHMQDVGAYCPLPPPPPPPLNRQCVRFCDTPCQITPGSWLWQVRQVMQAWSQEADAKSTAAAGTYGPSRPVAARMRTSVKVEQASRGGTASRPQPPGEITDVLAS